MNDYEVGFNLFKWLQHEEPSHLLAEEDDCLSFRFSRITPHRTRIAIYVTFYDFYVLGQSPCSSLLSIIFDNHPNRYVRTHQFTRIRVLFRIPTVGTSTRPSVTSRDAK